MTGSVRNGVNNDVNDQVTPSELRGLKGPIKVGELGLKGEELLSQAIG